MPVPLVEGDILEIRVNGIQVGQSVQNVIHYVTDVNTPTVTLEGALARFQSVWRGDILPLVSTSYRVESYVAKRISQLTMIGGTLRTRYSAIYEIAGDPVDDVGEVAGAFLPSYVAVGAQKITAGPQSTAYAFGTPTTPYNNAEKIFRGSIRIGGLVEADTEAAQGNDLTAAAETAFGLALEEIRQMVWTEGTGAGRIDMVIASFTYGGVPRGSAAAGGIPFLLAFQPVTALDVNPFVASQVTRKQRSGGA